MNRRDFLVLVGGGALATPLAGCCVPKQSGGTTAGIGVVEKYTRQFERTAMMVRTTAAKAAELARHPVRIAGVDFDAEDLMPGLRGRLKISGRDYAWKLLRPRRDFNDRHPWDRAHDLKKGVYRGGELLGPGDMTVYVEPDLEHGVEFNFERCVIAPLAAREAERAYVGAPYDGDWPPRDDASFAWHLGKSELSLARDHVGGAAGKVRIAILDTGYNRASVTIPEGIQVDAAYDFLRRQPGAIDPGADGLLCNSGHGTATMAILAGRHITLAGGTRYTFDNYLGGTPGSKIIPVRIADSVVHFFSSTMANGITYALNPNGGRGPSSTPCDVISISMGGVPSEAWADAINAVYEAGIVVVAAAGNNFNGLPVRSVVWPARFRRALPVCGATYDDRGYVIDKPSVMQGNYGPEHVMRRAIAAYSPNITWARWGQDNVVNLNGAGTSSATPQVAAACALWLAKYGEMYPKTGLRVEAVRTALLSNADTEYNEYLTYFGNGVLRARRSLDQPSRLDQLQEQQEDAVRFPLLEGILNKRGVMGGQRRMYEIEAAQIVSRSHKLDALIPNWDDPAAGGLTAAVQRDMLDLLIADPFISAHLRSLLLGARPGSR